MRFESVSDRGGGTLGANYLSAGGPPLYALAHGNHHPLKSKWDTQLNVSASGSNIAAGPMVKCSASWSMHSTKLFHSCGPQTDTGSSVGGDRGRENKRALPQCASNCSPAYLLICLGVFLIFLAFFCPVSRIPVLPRCVAQAP